MKKTALYLVSLVVLVILLGASMAFVGSRPSVRAVAASNCISTESNCLSGWAWSSNIGWVSFNSTDSGTGSTVAYDVAIDNSGNLSGYGWSNNIGWISFNSSDLSVSPACSGTAPANVNTASGAVTGWARAVVGKGRTDGWDGCIELSGTNHSSPDTSGYNGTSTLGVTYSSSSHKFSGFSWGGDVVGWLQFGPTAGYDIVCAPTGVCPGTNSGLALQVFDPLIGWSTSTVVTADSNGNVAVNVQWTPNNVTNVKTAIGSDWPEGTNVPTSGSGVSFTTPGTESVSFTNTGSTQITKTLMLSYYQSGIQHNSSPVTIYINPYVAASSAKCVVPAHATFCDPADAGQTGTAVGAATCSTPKVMCEFTCDTGYKLKGGICAKSSIEEI
ncbi:MAG: hypothetical protein V4524_00675 [Patescibacteria group bacterium]